MICNLEGKESMLRLLTSRSLSLAFIVLSTIFVAGCANNYETSPSNSATPANSAAATPSAVTTPRAKLNINTATGPEFLSTIPGLGNRMVHEFEEYRPYTSIQQFRREIGKYVDPAKVAEYEKYIFVPIDINQADAETLMQIPGLDQAEAESLIAGRPYASPQEFLTKLGDKVSAADLEIARTYLTQQ
jgi:DNA uptake protein ComE-like DNA-binding protein